MTDADVGAWTIRGMSAEHPERIAAIAAAQRAGTTIGAWLAHAIRAAIAAEREATTILESGTFSGENIRNGRDLAVFDPVSESAGRASDPLFPLMRLAIEVAQVTPAKGGGGTLAEVRKILIERMNEARQRSGADAVTPAPGGLYQD